MIQNAPQVTAAPCECHSKKSGAGLGFLNTGYTGLPSLDWKLILIAALLVFIVYHQQMSKPNDGMSRRGRRVARRLDASTWR